MKLLFKKKWGTVKLFIATAVILFFSAGQTFAQTSFVISGIVTDTKGAPLQGASVLLKGTTIGTATDAKGMYKLTAPDGAGTLVITYTGYQLKEVVVNNLSTINITLSPEENALNDVVVTGYSKQSKRDVTGAVSTISGDVIAKTPVTDIGSVLQGRVAGVSVDNQGGPSSTAVVRIRGFGTLGNNDPLYVVDGVQMRGGNNLINPNDIETITILKDPSLTSLYGAQGGNGVIVITTKTGKNGPPKLEYSSYVSSENPIKYPSLVSPQEHADAFWNYFKNANPAQTPTSPIYGNGANPVLPDYIIEIGRGSANPLIAAAGSPEVNPALYNLQNYRILQTNKAGTDWFREVFQNSISQSHQLTVSGGTDKSSYAIGFNYLNNQGILHNTFFKRYSLRANTDFKVKPWLTIGENAEFSYSTGSDVGSHSPNNIIASLYGISPLLPVRDIAGNFAGTSGTGAGLNSLGGGNPVNAQSQGKTDNGYSAGFIGSAYIDIQPLRGLIFESKVGLQIYPYEYRYFLDVYPQETYSGAFNSFSEGGGTTGGWRWTNKVSYEKTFNGIHKFSGFVGYEASKEVGRYHGATTPNLPYSPISYRYLSSGVPVDSLSLVNQVNGGGDISATLSVFGNVNYTLLNKYLISAVVRRDGSSKFGTLKRYGTFPSISAGWRITQEEFMEKIDWLNELKLRAAYGENGNDAIPSGQYLTQYTADTYTTYYDLGGTNNSAILGFAPYQLGNPSIHWETNKTTNLGFDASLLKNSISVSFNWFNRTTDGLLYAPAVTYLQGDVIAPYKNIMKFRNKGIELEAGYHSPVNRKFSYEMNANFATYRNEVLYIDGTPNSFIGGASYGSTHFDLNRSVVGMPVSSFFGYIQEGIFQSADEITNHATQTNITPQNGIGHFKFKDISGPNGKPDGFVNDYDRTFLGSPHPKFTYGYNINLNYKNFDLSIFIQGVAGNKIFNYWRVVSQWPGAYGAGSTNTWSPDNTDAKLPIWSATTAGTDNVPSSFFIEDGSYLRFKNVSLGYNIPASKTFSRLRVYIQGYNLFTITKYSGIDPEISTGDAGSAGVDFGGNYPVSRKFILGINIGL